MGSGVARAKLIDALPAPWPEDLLPEIRAAVAAAGRRLVVLDDDPTGTQTVYDVPVLTTWDVGTLRAEFAREGACFYLLTNSRALPAAEAIRLTAEIGRNLLAAAAGSEFVVVSRSDSTLRGHYPAEVDVLGRALFADGQAPPVLLVPFFEAGGRLTIDDVHYVAEGDALVPAAETPFARDAAFGYRHSNLREWVAEKTEGRVPAAAVASISLDEIRGGGPDLVERRLTALGPGQVCIVNAAAARDLEVLALATLGAERQGRRFLYRTAASFVAARLGLAKRPLLGASGGKQLTAAGRVAGGLTVVGSYVPKSTEQLNRLLARSELGRIELPVGELLGAARGELIVQAALQVSRWITEGRDALVFTSRECIQGDDAGASLQIGARISEALVELVQGLAARPRYLIAKGGITSSDLATRGLGVKRAMVLGQLLPGVPVWELGPETRFSGLPYVVFPGNVGGPDALVEAVDRLRTKS